MFDGVALDINLQLTDEKPGEIVAGSVTDDELVRAVLDGDEAAFTVIFERYRRLAIYLAGRFFRDRAELEEIVQQSFTKIYFSLKSYRGGHEKSFSAWLSKLTINVCYDELRRRKRQPSDFLNDYSDDERDFLSRIAGIEEGGGVENSLIAADLAEKILSVLDPKERVALTLVYGENFSIEEVSETVGWSKSMVKTRLFRCRNKLRKRFGHMFG